MRTPEEWQKRIDNTERFIRDMQTKLFPEPLARRKRKLFGDRACNTCGKYVRHGQVALKHYGRGGLHHIQCLVPGTVLANGELIR